MVDLYRKHPCIAPPWDEFIVGYLDTDHIQVLHSRVEHKPSLRSAVREAQPTGSSIDWERVRWRIDTFMWARDPSRRTVGPLFILHFDVYEDGSPALLSHTGFGQRQPTWEAEHAINMLLGTLKFLNAGNVELVEPARSRHVKKRLARHGVKVYAINIWDHTRRGQHRTGGEDGSVALHDVRGHFAYYGPRYGRGLLFGKHETYVWVPSHQRGSSEHGSVSATYQLRQSDPNES